MNHPLSPLSDVFHLFLQGRDALYFAAVKNGGLTNPVGEDVY